MRSGLLRLLVVASAATLAACSNGSDSGSAEAHITCPDNELCLVSCSVGCGSGGCSQTSVVPNLPLVFTFDKAIDPASVGVSSIRLHTAAGEVAQGDYAVHAATATFTPSTTAVAGSVVYGLRPNETYTLELPIGGVKGSNGAQLQKSLTCTLNVAAHPQDLNGRAPTSQLVVPVNLISVPTDVVIQVQFDELLDLTSFSSPGAGNNPIQFNSRGTRTIFGMVACDPTTPATPIAGDARIDLDVDHQTTLLSFTPQALLPANSCIEIAVTSAVKGVSGQAAQPALYRFVSGAGPSSGGNGNTEVVEETFDNDSQLDTEFGNAVWSGGLATFTAIGGDGSLGEFDLATATDLGVALGVHSYSINCDSYLVPGDHTLDGLPRVVSDGRFNFSRLVVPPATRIVFTGTNPPQISVRGRLQIDGTLDVRGEALAYYAITSATVPGQTGGAGGVSGGRGGQGGDKCPGTGATTANSGRNGTDVHVLAGHAYAGSVAGTGGHGSSLFPATGLNSGILFNTGTVGYTLMAAAGGSGGGFTAVGGLGNTIYNTRTEARASGTSTGSNTATTLNDTAKAWTINEWVGKRVVIATGAGLGQGRLVTANTATQLTVDAAWSPIPDTTSGYQLPLVSLQASPVSGGTSFPALVPSPGLTSSSIHFLVGGSGGGGGGSHPLFSNNFAAAWAPGCGGGGGGGAIALRAGRLLQVGAAGQILANGGSSGTTTGGAAASILPCPGGGGSGGSVLLQTSGTASVTGLVDVRGGDRGYLNRSTSLGAAQGGGTCETAGGVGSPGFTRFEAPVPPALTDLPAAQPPATANTFGALTDIDSRVAFQSLFYTMSGGVPLTYLRYEVVAIINNQQVTFASNTTPARFTNGPLQIYFQTGFQDTATGQVVPGSLSAWRDDMIGLVLNSAAGTVPVIRFVIMQDRTIAAQVSVDAVRTIFRRAP